MAPFWTVDCQTISVPKTRFREPCQFIPRQYGFTRPRQIRTPEAFPLTGTPSQSEQKPINDASCEHLKARDENNPPPFAIVSQAAAQRCNSRHILCCLGTTAQ